MELSITQENYRETQRSTTKKLYDRWGLKIYYLTLSSELLITRISGRTKDLEFKVKDQSARRVVSRDYKLTCVYDYNGLDRTTLEMARPPLGVVIQPCIGVQHGNFGSVARVIAFDLTTWDTQSYIVAIPNIPDLDPAFACTFADSRERAIANLEDIFTKTFIARAQEF